MNARPRLDPQADGGGGGSSRGEPLDVAELLDEALQLDAGKRDEFLASVARRDPAAAMELRELIGNLPDPEPASASEQSPAPAAADDFIGEPAEGEVIGGCRIDSVLGRGGVGTVFSATQLEPKRAVALKVLRTAGARVSHMRRFRTEAAVLGRLSHPAIARIYSSGVATRGSVDMPFLVMERIEGARSIVEWAAGAAGAARPSRAEMVRCIATVCDAMAFAHGRGVLHRDIKPSNVLVGADGQPRVIDFGIARVFGDGQGNDDTVAGALIGTPGYMAPEQFELVSADLDVRVDVHAIGVLLYEMLAGRRPYDIPRHMYFDAAQLMRTIQPAPLERVDATVPRDLAAVVGKAMNKDREQRYATMAELAEDLRHHLAGEPVRARPDPMLRRLARFARRHPTWTAAIAATLAGLALSAAISRSTLGSVRDLRRYAEGQRELVDVQRRVAEEQRVRAESTLLLAAAQGGSIRDVEAALESIRGRVDPIIAGFARRMLDHSSGPPLWRASAHLETGALSPDRTRWIVAGEPPRAAIVDLLRGTVEQLEIPEMAGWGACFGRDGARVYVMAESGTLYVRDGSEPGAKFRELARLEPSSMQLIEGFGGRRLLVAHGSGDVSLVDTQGGQVWTTRTGRTTRMSRGMAWNGSGPAFVAFGGSSVGVVDLVESGEPVVRDFALPPRVAAGVHALALSPDGKVLAVGTSFGEVAFVDSATGADLGGCSVRHDVWDISFSPDGSRIAVSDRGGHVHEFEVATGRELGVYGVYSADPAWAVGHAADGTLVANIGNAVHRIDPSPAWAVSMQRNPAPIAAAFATVASEQGRPERLRAFGLDGKLRELAPETGLWREIALPLAAPTRVAEFDSRASRLAAWMDESLVLFDLTNGFSRSVPLRRSSSAAVAWSPSGGRVAAACIDLVACVLEDGTILRLPLQLGTNAVYRIEWTDESRFVLFDFPGVAAEFEIADGALRRVGGHPTVSAPNPRWIEGRWIFPTISGPIAVTGAGGTPRLADLGNGRALQLAGHRDMARSVDVSDDGTLLVSGGHDGTVRIWNLADGAPMVTLAASDRPIQHVCWIDGKRALLVVDYLGRVHLFDSTSRMDRLRSSVAGAP